MKLNHLYHGDCLKIMKSFPENSIDMILCDLPYGVTACKWDSIIDIDLLFNEYRRIIKVQGCISLFGTEPFSSILRYKNLDLFKYDWIWKKNRCTGHLHAKNKPLKQYEIVSIFSKGTTVHKNQSKIRMIYNPIFKEGAPYVKKQKSSNVGGAQGHKPTKSNLDWVNSVQVNTGIRYPTSILEYSIHNNNLIHPTQKPVELFEYLIKTYTNENDIVLDNCIGSGTTAIAAMNTNRKWMGIEKDEEYYRLALDRIENHKKEGIEENKKIKFRIPV